MLQRTNSTLTTHKLWATLIFVACSSEEPSSELGAEQACSRKFAVLCDAAFECFTADELEAASDTVGSDPGACRGLFAQYCTPEMVACGVNQTYVPEMGEACVTAFEQFSCEDLRGYLIGTTTPEPPACDQVCTP
jgi:hypothetical protein